MRSHIALSLSLASFFSLTLSLSLFFFLLILPLSGVEERTLEALGALDERYHEDVGQRGFNGHEDLVARGKREVRGRGLRRRGRHLASSLELLRASVRVSWWCVVWCGLCAFRFAPLRPRRPRGASGSSRAAVVAVVVSCAAPLRSAPRRTTPRIFLSLPLSVSLPRSLARSQSARTGWREERRLRQCAKTAWGGRRGFTAVGGGLVGRRDWVWANK